MTDLTKVDLRLAVTDDVPPGDIPYKVRCRQPNHDDPGASMAVYEDHLCCYGCGFQVLRRMEALAYLLNLPSWREAIKVADRYTMERLDNYRERAKVAADGKPLPVGIAIGYAEILRTIQAHRLQWLYDRGLTKETVHDAMLGHDLYHFTIPVFNSRSVDGLVTIRFRNDDFYGTEDELGRPYPKYTGWRGRNGTYLYGADWLYGEPDHVYVCEGELDALRLHQEGLPAVSPTNGVRQLKYIPELLKPFPSIKTLLICSDQDEPGELGAKELAEAARDAGLASCRIGWSGEHWGKDVTEFLKNGGNPWWK